MTGRDFLAGRVLGLTAAETATLVDAIADGHAVEDDLDLARPVDGEWQYANRDQDGNVWEYEHEEYARIDASHYGWTLLRRRVGDWQEVAS